MDNLQVLVTGVGSSISRDAVRALADQGAMVTAIDGDADRLARFERDLSLYRTQVQATYLDLGKASEVRVFEKNLRFFGRLPHVLVCCCDSAGMQAGTCACASNTAADILQPSLFLHAAPVARSRVRRRLSTFGRPTLTNLLARRPGRGLFEPYARIPFVRLGSHLYSLSRGASALSTGCPHGFLTADGALAVSGSVVPLKRALPPAPPSAIRRTAGRRYETV